MSQRTGRASNLSPADIELEESNAPADYQNDKNATEKQKKKKVSRRLDFFLHFTDQFPW